MITYETFLHEIRQQLSTIYDKREALSIIDVLLEDKYQLPKVEQILRGSQPIPDGLAVSIQHDMQRLLAYEPVQYVTGLAYCYGLPFKVNHHVLIPRPETEELIDLVIKDHQNNQGLSVLDIGTGSGCIAVCFAKHINSSIVSAIDVSPEASAIAADNARLNEVTVNFQLLDFLNAENRQRLGKFDIIVSNPPYIGREDKTTMAENVLDYEPHLALFPTGADPLIFYRIIADFAQNHLFPNGYIYLELNASLANDIAALFTPNFSTVNIIKDMQGKERILKASRLNQ